MKNSNWNLIINNKKSINDLNSKRGKSIACVLAYFNGEKYIKEQIQSIIDQKLINSNLSIFISDDNSKIDFPDLNLLKFTNTYNLKIYYRKLDENLGYAKNFLYSLRSISSKFDYFCFADQDDIWENNKIIHALSKISKFESIDPILYCGRTIYYDEECKKIIGHSLKFNKNPSFKNAIIQNIAGGNTMLFNNAAKNLIVRTLIDNMEIISHDWWSYIIISGSGGRIYYDKLPFVKYRQHKTNLQGSNNSFINSLKRIKYLFFGRLKKWNEINIKALEKNELSLKKENKDLVRRFKKIRNQSFFKRIYNFRLLGIYRQTFAGNVALFLAFIIKKV